MIDTHNLIVDFGKHKGERWTRVPVGYLQWLANESQGERCEIAKAELARRGTTMATDLELSGHSLDRASQITNEWQEKGVYSWLTVIANEALEKAQGKETIVYNGYKFVFAYGNNYPVLKTVMRKVLTADEMSAIKKPNA